VVERPPDAELVRVEADHLAWIGPDADRAGRRVRAFAESIATTADPASRDRG
jgi:hypothetical protein